MSRKKQIPPVIKCFADFFTNKNDRGVWMLRGDGDKPTWLRDAIYEAHRGALPNDWVYEQCYGAACAVDEGMLDGTEDCLHMYADSAVDIYTNDLRTWYADNGSCAFVDDAEDYGDEGTIDERITRSQFATIRNIAAIIMAACIEHRDEVRS